MMKRRETNIDGPETTHTQSAVFPSIIGDEPRARGRTGRKKRWNKKVLVLSTLCVILLGTTIYGFFIRPPEKTSPDSDSTSRASQTATLNSPEASQSTSMSGYSLSSLSDSISTAHSSTSRAPLSDSISVTVPLSSLSISATSSSSVSHSFGNATSCVEMCRFGTCVTGVCECIHGYSGVDCDVACPNRCTAPTHGSCIEGSCVCVGNFAGPNCNSTVEELLVGLRADEGCLADNNMTDITKDLETLSVTTAQSDHSIGDVRIALAGCVFDEILWCTFRFLPQENTADAIAATKAATQRILALAQVGDVRLIRMGFSQISLDSRRTVIAIAAECPNGCSGSGRCKPDGTCVCFPLFEGEDCSVPTAFVSCPGDCSGNGACIDGICSCRDGFSGEDCSATTVFCPNDCGGQGICNTTLGQCECSEGRSGEDCSVQLCPSGCEENGVCQGGQCVCATGFTGFDCQEPTCSVDCGANGVCVNTTCVCDPGFNGEDCHTVGCVSSCTGNGKCRFNSTSQLWGCVCDAGYHGVSCQAALETNCTNGEDEDGDGLIDCADPDCCSDTTCSDVEECVDLPSTDTIFDFVDLANETADGTELLPFLEQVTRLLNTTQFNTSTKAFHLDQIAMVRGVVTDSNSIPLVGVRVAVTSRPEHGFTLSRSDGRYDLVIDAGGFLQFRYSRVKFIASQRTQSVAVGMIHDMPTVSLLTVTSNGTTISLNSTGNSTVQVASSGQISDTDGVRTGLLMITANNTATVLAEDGTETLLDQPTVRITEFTVGAGGSNSMPAELPNLSGYTYAVEISFDEADVDGTTNVVFQEGIPYYVENFLGFPVGTAVPVGSFNRTRGVWLPEVDGRVIKIIDIVDVDGVLSAVLELRANITELLETSSDANAQLFPDMDDDGLIDGEASLVSLSDVEYDPETGLENITVEALEQKFNITLSEKQVLAELYQVGQELWRILVPHATPWDCNWPYAPPVDACRPYNCPKPAPRPIDNDNTDDDSCNKPGSIISPASQSLTERLPLFGTPFNMYYSSDRMPGYHVTISVPLTTSEVSENIISVSARLEIAGRTFERTYSPAKENLTAQFEWDRRDNLNQLRLGPTKYIAYIDYRYPIVFQPSRSEFLSAFGRVGGNVVIEGGRSRNRDTSRTIVVTDTFEGEVSSRYDVRMLRMGGWSIDGHHYYDIQRGIIHFGSGRRFKFSVDTMTRTVVGGMGQRALDCHDCGNQLRGPSSVAAHPDGSIFIGDENVVYRYLPNGTMAVAYVFANSLQPITPYYMVVHPATGDLILSIPDHKRVYRLLPGSTLEPLIGTGSTCDFSMARATLCGEGGQALDLDLVSNRGIVVLRDGDIYLADGTRILHMTPDGIIASFIGSLRFSASAEPAFNPNTPINQVVLEQPSFLAKGPNGDDLYFIDQEMIYLMDDRSRLQVIAGYSPLSVFPPESGDETTATRTRLIKPGGLVVGPSGLIFFTETDYNARIHRVRMISREGRLSTLAGISSAGYPSNCLSEPCNNINESQDPQDATFNFPTDLAISGSSMFVADRRNFALREIGYRDRFTLFNGNRVVPEVGTSFVHTFDPLGRHLETRDMFGNRLLFSFGYDGDLLTSITGNGVNIALHRDPSTQRLVAVESDGYMTNFTLDNSGYIAAVDGPFGFHQEFDYFQREDGSITGLLVRRVDELGMVHQYVYNSAGRLVLDRTPRDARTRLLRVDSSTIAITLPENQQQIISSERLPDEDATRTVFKNEFGGLVITTVKSTGNWHKSFPTGLQLDVEVDSHPLWGVQVQTPVSERFTQPSGKSLIMTTAYEFERESDLEPLSVNYIVREVKLNGYAFMKVTRNSLAMTILEEAGGVALKLNYYNPDGTLLRSELPGTGLVPVTFEYAGGGLISHMSRGSLTTRYEYDSLDRITLWESSSGDFMRFEYEDNPDGARVKRLVFPSGRVFRLEYDRVGRMRELHMPSGAIHYLAYENSLIDDGNTYLNPNGDILRERFRKDSTTKSLHLPSGRTLVNSFDASGRVILKSFGANQIQIQYQAGTNEIALMRRIGASQAHVDIEFQYDGSLQTGFVTSYGNGVTSEVRMDVDAQWRPARLRNYINGALTLDVTVSFTGTGKQTSADGFDISSSNDGLTFSAIRSTNIGNKVISSDIGLEIERQVFTGAAVAQFTEQVQYATGGESIVGFVHRSNGLLLEGHSETDFIYDEDGQLVQVLKDGQEVEVYSYDENSNRIAWTVNDSEFVAEYGPDDALFTVNSMDYNIDRDGFLTNARGMSLTYSERGELLGVRKGSISITYGYDGIGRRVYRRQENRDTYFMYLDPTNPQRVTDILDDGAHTHIIYDMDGRVFLLERDGEEFVVLTNYVGTPFAVIQRSTQAVLLQRESDAFGDIISETGSFELPFGFASGLLDPDTGLLNFFRRDYDPVVGRFTAKDPLVFAGGSPNLYVYVFNDPVNFRDPLGLFCFGGAAALGIGIGGQFCLDHNLEISVCVRVFAGIGVSSELDVFGMAKENKMNLYVKAQAAIDVGALGSVGGQIAGGFDFTPDKMRSPGSCNGGFTAEVEISATIGDRGAYANYDAIANEVSYGLTRNYNLPSPEDGKAESNRKKKRGKFKAGASVEGGLEVCSGSVGH